MKIPAFSTAMTGLVAVATVLLQASPVEGAAKPWSESLTSTQNFVIADGWGPASWGSSYAKSQVHASTAGIKLTIGKDSKTKPFSGAEMIYSPQKLGYGKYSVEMIGTGIIGHVTGFYLISTEDGSEIDIELTGLNPKRASMNVWHNQKQNPVPIDLAFDVSKAWHVYEINFQQDSITWSIDNKIVLKRSDVRVNSPSDANYRVAINSWVNVNKETGSGWAGVFKYPTSTVPTSQFRNMTFTPN
ncbi:hypothetical protein BGZ83_005159 [Gryganskiella cystojenkinii]|nr:hypothetical protein BGZ83_005159 [Gryganskiella cystojenkinii]